MCSQVCACANACRRGRGIVPDLFFIQITNFRLFDVGRKGQRFISAVTHNEVPKDTMAGSYERELSYHFMRYSKIPVLPIQRIAPASPPSPPKLKSAHPKLPNGYLDHQIGRVPALAPVLFGRASFLTVLLRVYRPKNGK